MKKILTLGLSLMSVALATDLAPRKMTAIISTPTTHCVKVKSEMMNPKNSGVQYRIAGDTVLLDYGTVDSPFNIISTAKLVLRVKCLDENSKVLSQAVAVLPYPLPEFIQVGGEQELTGGSLTSLFKVEVVGPTLPVTYHNN